MFLIAQSKRHRAQRKWSFITLLISSVPLLLAFYAVNCVLTQHARLTVSITAHMAKVTGPAAVMAGWSYLAFALFVLLSDFPRKPRPLHQRVLRGLLRWGGFALALWFHSKAYNVWKGGASYTPTNNWSWEDWYQVGLFLGFLAVLVSLFCFLLAMFAREQVKKSLRERGLKPVHVRWLPFASWKEDYWMAFHVVYADAEGICHKSRCCTSESVPMEVVWFEEYSPF